MRKGRFDYLSTSVYTNISGAEIKIHYPNTSRPVQAESSWLSSTPLRRYGRRRNTCALLSSRRLNQRGKIAKSVAFVTPTGRTLDARGLVVAARYIDLHTHYDAQIHWDSYCTIAGWHGVTSLNDDYAACGIKGIGSRRALLWPVWIRRRRLFSAAFGVRVPAPPPEFPVG